MDSLDQMTETALAQIPAASTPDDALGIVNTFNRTTAESMSAWLEAEDVLLEPGRSLTASYRGRFGRGDKLEDVRRAAVKRVSDAANARFPRNR